MKSRSDDFRVEAYRYGLTVRNYEPMLKVTAAEPYRQTRAERLRAWAREMPWPIIWLMTVQGALLGFLSSLNG